MTSQPAIVGTDSRIRPDSAVPTPAARVATSLSTPLPAARNLARFVDERALTMRDRVTLLREICAVVRMADTGPGKPGLVLSPGTLWITATGHSSALGSAASSADPAYLSPQLCAGEPPGETDRVYALGAILWWLVTEESPTARGERAARAEHSAQSRFRRDLAAIARHAMMLDPAQRYASLVEFDGDLARWQMRRPVAANGRAWRYVARKWLERRWHLAVLTAIVASAALAAIAIAVSVWR